MPDVREFIHLEAVGAITTGSKDQVVMPVAGEIVNCTGGLGVAAAGTPLVFDILKNGVTTYSTVPNKPTLAVGALKVTAVAPDVTKFAAGDALSVVVVSVGTAATDLDVVVQFITV